MISKDMRGAAALIGLSLSTLYFGAGCAEQSAPLPAKPVDPIAAKQEDLSSNLAFARERELSGGSGALSLGSVDDRMSSEERALTREVRLAQIRDLGNGVFVFPATRDFPETLADFRETHPHIICVTPGPGATELYYSSHLYREAHMQYNSFVVVTGPAAEAAP